MLFPTHRVIEVFTRYYGSLLFFLGMAGASWGTDFARDVRPLLARHCFKCHGPDDQAREAELRLDHEQGAKRDLGGYAAVVAGDPAASELMERIGTDDLDLRMPPPESGRKLSESCLLYTSPSPRDQRGSRMPSSA